MATLECLMELVGWTASFPLVASDHRHCQLSQRGERHINPLYETQDDALSIWFLLVADVEHLGFIISAQNQLLFVHLGFPS